MAQQEFVSLLKTHQNIVHKVCNLYMDQYKDKEDLFQEITLQAWKAYQSFRGDAKFSTWLYRIALNTAITFYRKEKRSPSIYTTDELPETISQDGPEPIEAQLKAMYIAIGDLSKIDKAIVMLYLEDYLESMSSFKFYSISLCFSHLCLPLVASEHENGLSRKWILLTRRQD